jgi:hypothetical protein
MKLDSELLRACVQPLQLPPDGAVTWRDLDIDEEKASLAKQYDLKLQQLEDISLLSRAESTDPPGIASEIARIDLSINDLTEMAPLSGFINLRWLDLSVNHLTGVGSLAEMRSLCVLNLSNNELKSLDGLGRMPSLTYLVVTHLSIVMCSFDPSVAGFESKQSSVYGAISSFHVVASFGVGWKSDRGSGRTSWTVYA